MKKLIGILVMIMLPAAILAQKYITKSGYISFYGHTPLEKIFAENNQVASILDSSTGEIVFQGLMKSFHFEKTLMEEHFNENFIESDKYPRFTFKGKIINLKDIDFSKQGVYNAEIRGEMIIHNVTRQTTLNGTLETVNGNINGKSKFNIRPEDYNIAIPGILREKIAKEMEVVVDVKYSPMK